jgi:hypothetical protein
VSSARHVAGAESDCHAAATKHQQREIGTELAQTGHTFTGIVIGVGGGTTPRPYRVGAETDSAGSGVDAEGVC